MQKLNKCNQDKNENKKNQNSRLEQIEIIDKLMAEVQYITKKFNI